MKQPKYFQLEPDGFLSDADFQGMSDAERGAYFTIILYLYKNNGKIDNNPDKIARLCNSTVDVWDQIKHKFIDEDGFIGHKRVNGEIQSSKDRMHKLSDAGSKGAKARWHKDGDVMRLPCDNDNQPMPSKVKVSKVKKRKEKILLSFNKSFSSFYSWFEQEFAITTKQERGTFAKYAKLYAGLASLDKSFNARMCDKLEDMKKDAVGDPVALKKMWVASINNEIERAEVSDATS